MRQKMVGETLESQIEKMAAFVGTPAEIIDRLHAFDDACGGCDHASMQVNFNDMSYADADRSVRLFGETVIPHSPAVAGRLRDLTPSSLFCRRALAP